MLINCGVTRIWYAQGYPDELALQMLKEAGVALEQRHFLPIVPQPSEFVITQDCGCTEAHE